MRLVTHFYSESEWVKVNHTFAKGRVFMDNRLLNAKDISDLLSRTRSLEEFTQTVKSFNGFFVALTQWDHEIALAVDQILSMPLFYGTKQDELIVSDDADWIREYLGNPPLDPLAEEEFLMTGFVTGSDTLCASIKQLQSGEIVLLEYEKNQWKTQTVKYYQFCHQEYWEPDENDLLEKYRNVIHQSFKRALKIVDGRQIVVPLSSGFDSRLVILTLKELGYDNVQTFSYGRENSRSLDICKTVAEKIGFPWRAVLYSPEKWQNWILSSEWAEYKKYAVRLRTIPVLQDWPAIWELKNNHLIQDNCILIAGHAADPLAGSRITITPEVLQNRMPSSEEYVSGILKSHYVLWPWPVNKRNMISRYSPRVLGSIGGLSQYKNWASAFDAFNENERQAKFIVNILRATEFWGYDWWMPLFDKEYFTFWEKVPVSFRIGERLHVDYINLLYKTVTGEEFPFPLSADPKYNRNTQPQYPSMKKKIYALGQSVWRSPLFSYWRNQRRTLAAAAAYENEPMAWFGIMDKNDYVANFIKGGGDINSLLAAEYLGKITFDK